MSPSTSGDYHLSQEIDQRGLGGRLCKKIVKHVNWTGRMPWIVVDGRSWWRFIDDQDRWVSECYFWYRLTRVVPDKGPQNGCSGSSIAFMNFYFRYIVWLSVRYLFLILIVYGCAFIPFVYVLSFLFKVPSSGYIFVSIFTLLTGTPRRTGSDILLPCWVLRSINRNAMLLQQCLPTTRRISSEFFIFQQDSARCAGRFRQSAFNHNFTKCRAILKIHSNQTRG